MELKFKLSQKDISDCLVFSGKQDKFSIRRNIVIRWTFTLIFIVLGAYSYFENEDLNNLLISIGIGLLFYFVFPILMKADLIFESKSDVKSTFKSLINVPIIVNLNQENLLITVDKDEQHIPLTKLENIIEDEGKFYFELGGTLPLIVPRSDNYDIDLFISEIKKLTSTIAKKTWGDTN